MEIDRMGWCPLTPAHSIERVRLVLQFKQAIPEKMSRQASEQISKLSAETRLTGSQSTQTVQFGFEVGPDRRPSTASAQSVPSGWQFVRSSPDQLPIEAISVSGNQIVYETTHYRRWTIFKQRYMKVASPIVSLALGSLDLEAVALEYLDKFWFDGEPSEASPVGLVSNVAGQIHPNALSGRKLWHLHRGWYEAAEHGDFLIVQNMDAVDGATASMPKPARWIGILTKAEARAQVYRLDEVDHGIMLDLLHSLTGLYFGNVVQPEILSKVGIVKGTSE